MKTIILSFLLVNSLVFRVFAEEFKFSKPTLESYTNIESVDDKIITIGSIQIRSGDLRAHAGLSDKCLECSTDEQKSFFDDKLYKTALDASLVAALLHVTLQAENDKKKHALVGSLIGFGATKLCQKLYQAKDNRLICALTGAGAALLAGIGKEYYDRGGRGTVDAMDAVYTFVPGALISFKF